jgi:hypothetical protein
MMAGKYRVDPVFVAMSSEKATVRDALPVPMYAVVSDRGFGDERVDVWLLVADREYAERVRREKEWES